MRRFLKKLSRPFIYWYYWSLDYLYVGFWQLLGFFRRTDIRSYLQPSWKPHAKQVLLIPGVYERWEFMKPIAQSLIAAGYSVHVIEGLGRNTGTVEEAAAVVERYVADEDLRECVIVAHSKGGLIGKYLLSFGEEKQRFAGMVTLNTPFGGSLYAYLFPFASLRVFAPTSQLLTLLATAEEANERIYSIYGTFDPHIPKGSFLEGAHNIQLPTYGHFRVVKDRRVRAEVVRSVGALLRD